MAEHEAERQAKAAEQERQKQKDAVARVATSILESAGRTAANQIVRPLWHAPLVVGAACASVARMAA